MRIIKHNFSTAFVIVVFALAASACGSRHADATSDSAAVASGSAEAAVGSATTDTVQLGTYYSTPTFASTFDNSTVDINNIVDQNPALQREFYVEMLKATPVRIAMIKSGDGCRYIGFSEELQDWVDITEEEMRSVKDNYAPEKLYLGVLEMLRASVAQ